MIKQTKIVMGIPITIEIVDQPANQNISDKIFNYFEAIDKKFSTYKATSEISQINQGKLQPENFSEEMQTVLKLSAKTKKDTHGYFDIETKNGLDPSGLVKGWAILNAAELISQANFKNFYVEAGGDIEARGHNSEGQKWSVGVKNPFKTNEIVKVVYLHNMGMATSGSYERGQHIYNPFDTSKKILDVVSLTVIGKNVYEADRFATAAFAMGKDGINFIEKLPGLEGYIIDKDGIATMTSGFEKFTKIS